MAGKKPNRKSAEAAPKAGPAKAPALYAYVNGRVTPADKAVISIFDRGLVLGDGLFETLRATGGHPQFLDLHFKRLAKSAKRLQIALPIGEKSLRALVTDLCRRSRLDDAVVRITLTRGHYQGGLAMDKKIPPSLIVTVAPVSGLPPALYEKGVKVAISTINKAAASGLDSTIKSTNYLANIFAKAQADKKGAYEAILLGPHGEIAELSTSSFFAVIEGVVVTPPIDTGILPGITRQVLLRVLKKEKVPHHEGILYPKDIPYMSEAFLSSSVRGLVPITRIEGSRIGNGKVGAVFKRLQGLYAEACEAETSKPVF